MTRQNKQLQDELEPKRIKYAKERIEALGYTITKETNTCLTFEFKGSPVQFFPYSGWHAGKTIQDGRGIAKLLKQINNQ